MYAFGQSITFWFYPLIDDTSPATILTSQTPAIYVFDYLPTRAQAAAGTSAVQSISSWTWNAEAKGWSFTISPVNDPDPASTQSLKVYYLGINFRLQTTQQIQTVVKSLELERVVGHTKTVEVTQNDLRNYYPQIDSYTTEPQRKAYIEQAILHVKNKLKAAGFSWSKLHRPDELKKVVTLKALAMILFVSSQESNDKHWVKYQELQKEFELSFSSLQLEYDSDGDGASDGKVNSGGTVLLLR